jgi:hypothetical protein
MNKSFLKGLFVALAFVTALSVAGCSDNANVASEEKAVIEGAVTFTYNDQPIADAAKWPTSTDTSAAFPGRIKVAFVPLDPATLQPRVGPVSGLPGLGNSPGIQFSELNNGVYSFSSEQARDGNGNLVTLPKDIYGVYPTYVNAFYEGQAAQQFIINGQAAVADLRNQNRATVACNATINLAETLMQAGRSGTATLSGTVTATNGIANWPVAPVGPPQAWAAGTEYIAVFGTKVGAPPGPPGIFIILGKPASGNSVSFVKNLPLGTYTGVKIQRYKVNPAAPGGFETLATLAEFRHPITNENSMTMDNANRQGVWNVSIAP